MKVQILLPNIFNHPFTYESNLNLKVGDYVMVPFGKSKITGVVWDEFEKKNNRNFKVKNVLKKLDVSPLKKTTIKFLNWFSEYNIIPKGMSLKMVLLSSNAVEKLQKNTFKIFDTKIKKNLQSFLVLCRQFGTPGLQKKKKKSFGVEFQMERLKS